MAFQSKSLLPTCCGDSLNVGGGSESIAHFYHSNISVWGIGVALIPPCCMQLRAFFMREGSRAGGVGPDGSSTCPEADSQVPLCVWPHVNLLPLPFAARIGSSLLIFVRRWAISATPSANSPLRLFHSYGHGEYRCPGLRVKIVQGVEGGGEVSRWAASRSTHAAHTPRQVCIPSPATLEPIPSSFRALVSQIEYDIAAVTGPLPPPLLTLSQIVNLFRVFAPHPEAYFRR